MSHIPEKNIPPKAIQAYLSRNPLSYKLEYLPEANHADSFTVAIVIPVLAESEILSKTIDSLLCSIENSAVDFHYHTQIIIVVNNPPLPAKGSVDFYEKQKKIADNQYLLTTLRNNSLCLSKRSFLKKSQVAFCWLDASSEGCEINLKQGVGGARKLGMDAALHSLDWDKDPLIFSLDADTLVKNNYISAVKCFFNKNPIVPAATVGFQHQPGSTPYEEKAIRLYERFLHHYVDELRNAHSPYAYHSIGSTIICRASAYIKAGGMRPRPAGEDFYFMQALCKVGQINVEFPIGKITETCVYPSSRISDRVPFGTGARMTEDIARMKKDKDKVENPITNNIFYNPRIFAIIKEIISGVDDGTLARSYDKWFAALPKEAKDFFDCFGFQTVWSKIIQNTPRESRKIITAFHTWFDAFRILKFIHFCEKAPYNYHKIDY
jgi:hypothetical protein